MKFFTNKNLESKIIKFFIKTELRGEVIKIKELLDPKLDYVFKRIFGHKGNEDITKSLISSILKKDITELTLEGDKILEKDVLDEKIGILDIRAKIGENVNCDIEIQVIDQKNTEKRILFYASKMLIQSITKGKDYSTIKKSIAILIADYELGSLAEMKKYSSKWNFREEEYGNIILTDAIEIYIIEMPKLEKYPTGTVLDKWVKFIKNPKVIDMSEKEIKKAKEVLEEISQDEHARRLAELREKYIMDQQAIEEGGYDKGLKKGKEQEKIEIAKKLLELGIEESKIIEATELTDKEIEKLKQGQ